MPNDVPASEYYRRAFWSGWNLLPLIGLVGAGAVLSTGFLFLAAAWELGWMYLIPNDPRFQRKIRAEFNREKEIQEEDEQETQLRRLPERDRTKFRDLEEITSRIERMVENCPDTVKGMMEQGLSKLRYLLRNYFRMLVSLSNLREYLKTSDMSQIKGQVGRLEEELKDESMPEKLRKVKLSNLDVLNQRLSKVVKAQENQSVMEANLQTLEDTLKLIRDNIVSMDNPQGVSNQINSIVGELQQNEQFMADMEHFLDTEKPLDDVGVREPPRERV